MLLVRWQERYLLQWHVPNGMLPCRWYIAREHDHWQSCKLSGYRCLPTVHQHQSPSARWYEVALEASSSLLMVRIMHWQPRDDLACKKWCVTYSQSSFWQQVDAEDQGGTG